MGGLGVVPGASTAPGTAAQAGAGAPVGARPGAWGSARGPAGGRGGGGVSVAMGVAGGVWRAGAPGAVWWMVGTPPTRGGVCGTMVAPTRPAQGFATRIDPPVGMAVLVWAMPAATAMGAAMRWG